MNRRKHPRLQLKQPKSSFVYWLFEGQRRAYLSDMVHIAGLVRAIAINKTASDEKKLIALERALACLDLRREYYHRTLRSGRHAPKYWDGRNWKRFDTIRKAMQK